MLVEQFDCDVAVLNVRPSITPSMDIQVSSNFERLLFELTKRDGSMVNGWMQSFADNGSFSVTDGQYSEACKLFSAGKLDDDETRGEMKRLYRSSGYIIDPHSAIGAVAYSDCYRRSAHG